MITIDQIKAKVMLTAERAVVTKDYQEGIKQEQDIMNNALQMVQIYSKFIEDYYKHKEMHGGQVFVEYIESLESRRDEYRRIMELASEQYNRLSRLMA